MHSSENENPAGPGQPSGEQRSTSSLQVGSILAGRYRILQHLGDGAMGSVYLGEHLKIGRKDAIKVLRDSLAGEPEAMARFVRGARGVSRIRHENVCTIYDFSDTPEGVQFLAMEYIPGLTLRELLTRDGTLPLQRVIAIAVQAAGALQAAHDAGIVHRDLKPANIMLMQGRDGSDIVKVVDFDIAKAEDDGSETEVTRFGFVVGTPEYMSPEQLTGESLDGRSDVYSLALVVYRMLTGLLPFPVENTREMLLSRLTRAPMTLEEILPGGQFPESIQRVLDWALQRNVEDRTPTATAFGRALTEAATSNTPSANPIEIPPTLVYTAVPGHVRGGPGVEPNPLPTPSAIDRRLLVGTGAVILAFGIAIAAWALRDRTSVDSDPNAQNRMPPAESLLARTSGGSNRPDSAENTGGGQTRDPNERDPRPDSASENRRGPGPPDPGNDRSKGSGVNRPVDIDALLRRQNRVWFTIYSGGINDDELPLIRAIADTAQQVWDESERRPKVRMEAAFLLGSANSRLDRTAGRVWAERALQLCERLPANRSDPEKACQRYRVFFDSYPR